MNEPESFATKVRVGSYASWEQGGVIWVYMGRPEHRPPEPNYEYTRVDESHRTVSKVWQECNWLQALEGGIDTSHAPILHRAFAGAGGGIASSSAFVRGRAPTLEVDFTDYGYRYTGIRPLDVDQQYVRGYHFVMPFTQIRPGQGVGRDTPPRPIASGHHWVPVDDYNCMVWNWHYSYGDHVLDEEERSMNSSGNGPLFVDFANDFRAVGNRRNNWQIDRDVQRTQTYTGIPGINAQDRAVQESMGSIVDRSAEHLGPADRAIISTRRLLSDAVRAVQRGEAPTGTNTSYYNIRSAEKIFAADVPWREVLLPEMYPEGEKQTAEAVLPRA
jgi:phenylpropionate dioxygenase-like ring-hydroxylating dioxygenase large terminal subunit